MSRPLLVSVGTGPGASTTRPATEWIDAVTVADVADVRPHLHSASHMTFVVAGDAPSAAARTAIEKTIRVHPDADLVYGDEVRHTATGPEAFHKPGWSPHRLLSMDYVGSAVTYRSDLLTHLPLGELSGLSPRAQLHGLALFAATSVVEVVHIPALLHHRSATEPLVATDDHVLVVDRWLRAQGVAARAEATDRQWAGDAIVGLRPNDSETTISIVMPTGGSSRVVRGRRVTLVDNALRSILTHSTHPSMEIIVVADAKSGDDLADRLEAMDPRVRVVRDQRPFNFAAACNLGAEAASGDVIVLLNDDTEVVTPDWLQRLSALTGMEDVGAVGVKLLYPDGRVQHGGLGARDDVLDHLYHGYAGSEGGHGGWLHSIVNCTAATGACLAVSRENWRSVGGMDEAFPLVFNDVDLCLRLAERGQMTVVDNQTELVHLETSSREPGSYDWEVSTFRDRWGGPPLSDPFDNPHLHTPGLVQVPPPLVLTEGLAEAGVTHEHRRWTRHRGHADALGGSRARGTAVQ